MGQDCEATYPGLMIEGMFTFTLDHINLEVTVGPMRTMNKFHIVGGRSPSYYAHQGDPGFTSIKQSRLPTTSV